MKKDSRKIVIIGGGVIGLGIAYHLAKLGMTDVLLVERHQLTSGTSWHAAGIVGPLRATMNMTHLAAYAVELFPKLEIETGLATGFQKTGGYWLASNSGRMDELHRISTMGERCGLGVEMLSQFQLSERLPWLDANRLNGGLFVEDDGQANPVDICMAYAKGARNAGIELREGVSCTDIKTHKGRVSGIVLSDDTFVQCDLVINSAGAWAREVGKLAGVPVPLQAVQHMYVVTDVCSQLPRPMPIIRDLDSGVYLKGDAGRVVFGGFESHAIPFDVLSAIGTHPYIELPEDWQQFEAFMSSALDLVPCLNEVGVQRFMNGPESFTPDSKPMLGESPYLRGFFVAAGMNSTGMMSSAGIGRAMAEWVYQGEAPMDLWEVDIARFGDIYSTQDYLHDRMKESVADVFAMHWPLKQAQVGRDLYKLPAHEQHIKNGAFFAQIAGWERPLWFSESVDEKVVNHSYRQQNWWPWVKREALHLSKHAALFDLSPFTKIDVSGSDCVAFLQWLCACNVDVNIGKVVYGQMLNQRGGIEADITVSRIGTEKFRITSAAATRLKDMAWISKHASDSGMNIMIEDRSLNECVYALMGPRSNEIVRSLLGYAIDDKQLPFSHSADFSLDGSNLRITRLSFVGEYGFEISCEKDNSVNLYEQIMSCGEEHELKPAGQLCLESCRLEKGYRHFGHDIGPDDTPLEAGLSFSVDWQKPDFIGKTALIWQYEQKINRKLMMFEVLFSSDEQPILLHDEPIYRDGTVAGYTTSGGRGFRTGKSICFAYINWSTDDSLNHLYKHIFSIKLNNQYYSLQLLMQPAYDPNNLKMKEIRP